MKLFSIFNFSARTALALAILSVGACVAHKPVFTDAANSPETEDTTVAELVRAMSPEPLGSEKTKEPPLPVELSDPLPLNIYTLKDEEQGMVGRVQVIQARAEDTFSDIARTYSLGFDELVNANPDVDPWLPGVGTPVVLPTQFVLPNAARRGIVLNIAAKRLFYYPVVKEGEQATVVSYPIGIGRLGWATPIGSSKVIAKAKNPAWYVPWSVRKEHREAGDPLPAVVPPGEDNPLGHRVLKLDLEGYLIHGTNQPYGVGMRVSHGCVRLYPEHIEILYDAVALGVPVEIVNQPLLGAWQDGHFYVQAHPPLEDDEVSFASHVDSVAGLAERVDASNFKERAAAVISEARGYPQAILNLADVASRPASPLAINNIVVVDNPVSEQDLAEMMAQNEDALNEISDE